jgi:hypothetical protein
MKKILFQAMWNNLTNTLWINNEDIFAISFFWDYFKVKTEISYNDYNVESKFKPLLKR